MIKTTLRAAAAAALALLPLAAATPARRWLIRMASALWVALSRTECSSVAV
ncbi:hypothetical protein [Streptomyces sp. NPDC101150]|uniref:hypothetical protein n=1 Tax=Streptomyces sp. NPDC101150 TaxID=3366114 RepID=UPI0037F36D9F